MSMFRKPKEAVVGVKVLFMGDTGSGKTTAGLSFPNVALVDAEAGASFYENTPKGKNLIGVMNSQSFDDLDESMDEVKDMALENPSQNYTLMVDSETKIYQNLTDASLKVEEAKALKKGKDVMDSAVSMRGWGRIKSVAQRLQNGKIDLSNAGVNIVSIAQIEDVKEKRGESFVKIGEKPIMQKGSEYDYDIIVKFRTGSKDGKEIYAGEILKDRTGVTKKGQIIENVSYEIWREYMEKRKQNGEGTLNTNMSSDAEKTIKKLHAEDVEKEKTIQERIKEVMALSDKHSELVTKGIDALGIKDMINPTATETEKIEKLLNAVTKKLK